ncbi:uncharacterized protein A4U43_C01F3970 [Asparagus officinalis]|uniref:GRIP domain-containing protein n=1 Tax=Asparagus officinalis TaxID=4686 RepID=A0A5P1FNA0_ASPOF|nr:golgin candidate 4-like [Asparagus officinalis]ONK79203.1 uncharacterized protein A4U43_C01F3970 [Asparagus officinalis]
MINSIATYKESLSRIANEVFDAAEEMEIPQSRDGSREVSPASGRRFSQRSSRFSSPVAKSPIANGVDHGSHDEVSKYKADIQRLLASEAEIKELAFSYAAVLKEKEEQLSKLREENGSLKKTIDAKESGGHGSRDESVKTLPNNSKIPVDRSPGRLQRNTSQGNSRSGSHSGKSSITKQDGLSNGSMQAVDATTQIIANSPMTDKEHNNLIDEAGSLAAIQASHESEIKQLKAQLDSEREKASTIQIKLQKEQQLKESSQRELQDLKIEKERIFTDMKELQEQLKEKITELRLLQVELSRRNMEEDLNDSLRNLERKVSVLEEDNAKLKMEKNELEVTLNLRSRSESIAANDPGFIDKNTSELIEKATEDMELSMWKLKESLEQTSKERDKALQELDRLKQHLLEKELEESDKMDEDSKVIEELRATANYQRAHILQLERALKQETASKEEIMKFKSDELQKSSEMINNLREKLANCMSIVDSKNIELQNLQTALGQYYAESEAKERLGRDLAVAREESAKLSETLKAVSEGLEISKREKEEILGKLSHAERMLSDGKCAIQKLEEDNSKLRRALEQNMTRLNRMSLDSDNYVDRRIVIKLLVTYFQRNHSKEVLDLMVRMLGFSEEEKQRIGFAQSAAGKGVVRGVLGLPGRLVGGILGGSSPEASSHASDNQSFADLWVDFLLKETEERERKESEEAARLSSTPKEGSTSSTKLPSNYKPPTSNYSTNQSLPLRHQKPFEQIDTEFATVPLNSSFSPSAARYDPTRMPSRY